MRDCPGRDVADVIMFRTIDGEPMVTAVVAGVIEPDEMDLVPPVCNMNFERSIWDALSAEERHDIAKAARAGDVDAIAGIVRKHDRPPPDTGVKRDVDGDRRTAKNRARRRRTVH